MSGLDFDSDFGSSAIMHLLKLGKIIKNKQNKNLLIVLSIYMVPPSRGYALCAVTSQFYNLRHKI